jgi:hypothetical protein
MKKLSVLNLTPALIGLGSLLVYILACTSFSPDDTKVLYDAVDGKTGMTGVAVYDRKTGKSEVLFQPFTLYGPNLERKAALLRPQWVEGGHSFLTAWRAGGDDSDNTSLNIAVLPFDRRGPARIFEATDLGDDGASLFYYWPVPVAGKYLFLVGRSNSIVRVDYGTGEMRRETNQEQVVPLPSPDNDRLFYLSGADKTNGASEYGVMDPETFARTPLFHIAEGKVSVFSLALSRDARSLAYQVEDEKPPVIHLLESGKAAKTLSLASLGGEAEVSVRQFSPKGDILYGCYERPEEEGSGVEYGLAEIPRDGSPARKTVLISKAPAGGKDQWASLQVDLSHDGKTVAVDSLWLAYNEHPINSEDCALFLVDVSGSGREVTKVAIPMPPKETPSPFGK